MKAVVLRRPRELTVEDIPVPEPAPGQVLIDVTACGICGSDLRYFEGENPWAKHTLGCEKPNPPNMVLGHEIAGMHQGRPVSCIAFRGCGTCLDCRRGRESLCAHTAHLGHGAGWSQASNNPGGMAERCPVWEEFVIPLPEGVSAAEGTFLDGLGVAVHAVRRAAIWPGGSVLVWGAGPIGACIMQVARAFGAGPIWVADVYHTAVDCAASLGADEAVLASTERPKDLADWALQQTAGRGVDVLFETTGDPAVQAAALGSVARGGTLMLMAGAAPGLYLQEGALAGERILTTSSNHQYEDFQIAVDLLGRGAVRVGPMITHRFPLENAARAFEVARHKEEHGAMKVVLEP